MVNTRKRNLYIEDIKQTHFCKLNRAPLTKLSLPLPPSTFHPLNSTHTFFNNHASTHKPQNSTARQKNHLFAPPSFFRKPYKCALPLSPHFCSRKLIPRPQAGASSKWSRLEACGHHSMARKHLTFLPSPLMEVTLVSVLFQRLSDRPVHQLRPPPTHIYYPHRQ